MRRKPAAQPYSCKVWPEVKIGKRLTKKQLAKIRESRTNREQTLKLRRDNLNFEALFREAARRGLRFEYEGTKRGKIDLSKYKVPKGPLAGLLRDYNALVELVARNEEELRTGRLSHQEKENLESDISEQKKGLRIKMDKLRKMTERL
jgi:hypothetical protein